MSSVMLTPSSLSFCVRSLTPIPAGRNRRGRVGSMSGRSRNHALQQALAVAPAATHIATLTFPGTIQDPQQVKGCLDRLGKAFLRQYPSGWIVWRLEPTSTGQPHFHALIGGVDGSCVDWVFQSWARITGAGPDALPGILTNVQPIDPARAQHWARYMCKPEPPIPAGDNFWARAGRRTGTIGRRNLPKASQAKEQLETTPERIKAVLAYLEAAWVPLAWDADEAAARRRNIAKARRHGAGLFLGLPPEIQAQAQAILRGEEVEPAAKVLGMKPMPRYHAQPRPRKPHGSPLPQARFAKWRRDKTPPPRQQRSGPQPRPPQRSPGQGIRVAKTNGPKHSRA